MPIIVLESPEDSPLSHSHPSFDYPQDGRNQAMKLNLEVFFLMFLFQFLTINFHDLNVEALYVNVQALREQLSFFLLVFESNFQSCHYSFGFKLMSSFLNSGSSIIAFQYYNSFGISAT